ncbi:MAG: DUF1549 domain-containing protein [Fuerstiella sp.]
MSEKLRQLESLVFGVICVVVTCPPVCSADDADRIAFFETRIRPVLIEHCYSCHSAKAKEVKGSLLVDSAGGLLRGGDSGTALIVGKPDESLLMEALRYEGLEMPPAARLPENVIRDFQKWVAMGAPDPRAGEVTHGAARTIDIERGRKFWAFQPVHDHEPPSRGTLVAANSSVDAFVEDRLTQAGLHPRPPADAETVVRRIYFDLTGLPPAPDELQAFVGNTSPTAFTEVVDRLLQSSQFGVHWGRHWLDVARYADSNGGDFNATFHNAWKYRDYVVDAMNNDKPFDRFVREQIAGDLLPFNSDSQRTEQMIATGFLMVGTKMLSERDKVKLQMDVVDEQINTVGAAFMGMTLGCARCHDHKFDPIPTNDYYALAGIFRSTRTLEGESQKYVSTWLRAALPADPEHVAAIRKHESRLQDLEASLKKENRRLTGLKKDSAVDSRLVVDDASAKLVGAWKSSTLTPRFIGKGYIHDDRNGKGEKSVEFSWKPPKSVTYEVRLSYTSGSTRASNVPVTISFAGGRETVTLDQTKFPPLDEKFAAIGRFAFDAAQTASVIVSNANTTGFVIVDAVQFVEVDDDGMLVAADDSTLSQQSAAELARQSEVVESLEQALKQLKKSAPPELPKAIAAGDLPTLGDCEVCIRGEHSNLGAKVPRGFLQVAATAVPRIKENQSGRIELADWIADAKHPLTARVIVNRVWSHLLGEGIVRSVDNFGELGERPTHPRLLDHLAARFVTPAGDRTQQGAAGFGWSIKSLIREILLSHVYLRSSLHDEASWHTDPDNRLLWKAHRRRLTAESLRDAMLKISGTLDLSSSGSPVQGAGTLVRSNSADDEGYQSEETMRRSLYLPIIRNELPSILTVFDFADPDLVVGKRAVTNVPAQALLMMNSPFVMDRAQQTAERLCTDKSQTVRNLIGQTYRIVLSRTAAPVELQRALAFLKISDPEQTLEAEDRNNAASSSELMITRLSRFVHVLFASTEFRMLN